MFDFEFPDHENDPTVSLTDALKIIREEDPFEVWAGGVMIFCGRILDVQKNKKTEEILNRLKVFRMKARDNYIVFFTV